MSLTLATSPDGHRLLEGPGPFDTESLVVLGPDFELPCNDPSVLDDEGPAAAYLSAARQAWRDTPEWMDFLDPSSPAHAVKLASRDLYLHWWAPWLEAATVLDVGCGIGRFSHALLDRGADVHGVDGDLQSLRRNVLHAIGRPGRLDLSWSSVHALPEGRWELVIAAEVLCYVPTIRAALDQLVARLLPGGTLLLSMEAMWGWATAVDTPAGAWRQALSSDPELWLPGDRWVRLYDHDRLQTLLEDAGLEVLMLRPSHYLADGPLEDCAGELDLDTLIEAEEAAAAHPVWGPLNRVWTVAARRPGPR